MGPANVRQMKGRARGARVRRLLLCLGLGALAPLGSISVGSAPAAVVVGLVLAAILWVIGDMLDEA
jgi:fatty acid desaturase